MTHRTEDVKRFKTNRTEEKENEDVVREIHTSRNLMTTGKRKTSLFGHILKHNDFIMNILEGKIIGKKRRGIKYKQCDIMYLNKCIYLFFIYLLNNMRDMYVCIRGKYKQFAFFKLLLIDLYYI